MDQQTVNLPKIVLAVTLTPPQHLQHSNYSANQHAALPHLITGQTRQVTGMKEALKNVGNIALGIAILVGVIVIAVFFIKGGLWLSEKLLPVLSVLSGFAFLACLFVLLPLALFQPTRPFGVVGLYIASYIFGASAWMSGLLLTYTLCGLVAVFFGLFLFGVGVVPLALIALLFKGLWLPFFSLFLMVFLTYACRFMALYLIQKGDETNLAV